MVVAVVVAVAVVVMAVVIMAGQAVVFDETFLWMGHGGRTRWRTEGCEWGGGVGGRRRDRRLSAGGQGKLTSSEDDESLSLSSLLSLPSGRGTLQASVRVPDLPRRLWVGEEKRTKGAGTVVRAEEAWAHEARLSRTAHPAAAGGRRGTYDRRRRKSRDDSGGVGGGREERREVVGWQGKEA